MILLLSFTSSTFIFLGNNDEKNAGWFSLVDVRILRQFPPVSTLVGDHVRHAISSVFFFARRFGFDRKKEKRYAWEYIYIYENGNADLTCRNTMLRRELSTRKLSAWNRNARSFRAYGYTRKPTAAALLIRST